MTKHLTRDAKNKKVAGVCAGVANYFKLDINLVRVIWILILVFTGFVPGIIAYVIAWAILSEK